MKQIVKKILSVKPVNALRIAFIYLIIGIIWFFFSDRYLDRPTGGINDDSFYLMLRGWFFVFITSILLYLLINNAIKFTLRHKEKLGAGEKSYRIIAEHMNDVVWVIDANTRNFSYVSPSVQKLNGYSVEEIISRSFEKNLTPDYRYLLYEELPRLIKQYNEGDKTSKTFMYEVIERCKDGSMIDVEISASFVEDKNGRVKEIYGRSRNISERKKTERALKCSDERNNTILRSIFDGYWLINKDGIILEVNDVYLNMTGYSRDELIGKHISIIEQNETAEDVQKHISRIIKSSWDIFESRHRRKDGVAITLEISASYMQGVDDRIAVFFRDVTKSRLEKNLLHVRVRLNEFSLTHNLEELLQKTLDEAEELTDSKIGFYHFMGDDQETVYLQMWSTNTMKNMCDAKGKGTHYNVSQAGVWVDCVATKQPVIHNDYQNLPHKKGLPEGHAPVLRELVVPVIREGKIKAIFGIGNKSVNYTNQDVEIVSLLADLAWDIVERKRSENDLRNSEQRFRTLAENIPGAVYRCYPDRSSKIIYMSDEIKNICGIDSNDFENGSTNIIDLIHKDDLHYVTSTIKKAVVEKSGYELEYRIHHLDNSERFVSEKGKVICDDKNQPLYLDGLIMDITRRKRIELAINVLTTSFSSMSGNEFFENVSKHVTAALDVDYAFVGELSNDKNSINVIGGFSKGQFITPFVYNLKNSPNRDVIDKGSYMNINNVRQLYQKDFILSELGIDGYIGSPLFTKDGKVLGIFVVLHSDGIKDEEFARTLIKIFSDQIVSEIERTNFEKKLIESEARWQFALEGSGAGVWDWNTETNEVYYSKQWKKLLGFEECEIGYSLDEWEKRVHPDDLPHVFEQLGKHFDGKESIYISEYRVKCKDGSYKWILDRGKVVARSGDGRMLRAIGTYSDINERKKTEEALKKSEVQLHAAMDIAKLGHWEYDVASDTFLFNDQFYRLLRTSVDEVGSYKMTAQEYAEKYIHPDEQDLLGIETQKVIESDDPYYQSNVQHRIICGDGVIRSIVVNIRTVKDYNGKTVKTFGVNQDITEQKNSQQALLESEEKFRLSFITSPDAVNINRLNDGVYLDINEGFTKLTGFTKEDVINKTYAEIDLWVHQEDRKKLLSELKSKRICHNLQAEFRNKNGSVRTGLMSATLIKIKNEMCILSITRDISDLVHIQEALQESEERYKELYDLSPDAIIVHQNERIIFANPASLKLFGANSENEIIGREIIDFVQPDFRSMVLNRINEMTIADKSAPPIYEKFIRLDGSSIDVEVVSTPIKLKGESAYQMIARDITQRKRAEEILRESEQKLTALINSTPDIICFKDASGRWLKANNGILEIYQLKNIDYVNKTEWELALLAQERYREAFRTCEITDELSWLKGSQSRTEEVIPDGEGNPRVFDIIKIPLFNEDGSRKALVVFGRDITDRKRIEKALRTEKDKFSKTFFTSPDGMVINKIDDHRIVELNEGFALLSGYSRQELLDGSVQIFDLWAEPEKIEESETKILTEGHYHNLETKLRTMDGEIVDILISASTIKLDDSQCILYMIRDISELKKTGIALKESEERYRDLFNHLLDGFAYHEMIINSENKPTDYIYLAANPRYEQITGLKLLDIIGKRISEVMPDKSKYWIEMYSSVALNNTPKRFESFNEVTGKYYRVVAYSPERLKFATIIEDITDKVLNEKELEMYRSDLESLVNLRTSELDKVNKQLVDELRKDKEYEMMLTESLRKEKELSDLKTRFISTASHEFRTPLTSILSSTELIERYRKRWGEEKFDEHFSRVKKSVEYLTKLLDDVLIISRTDSGKIIFTPSPTNLKAFCEEVINEAAVHSKKEHSMIFNYQARQKEFLLDQKLLKFILVNLLANAFKYSPNGGKVEFCVSLRKANLIFTISDEGIGIPDEEKHNMFEPFHRNINSANIPGTGLGLSIVKRSVDLHNGRITYESKLNMGTKFTVMLPILK